MKARKARQKREAREARKKWKHVRRKGAKAREQVRHEGT